MARARVVSIVIDNFNYAHFLRRSIDSALAQTCPDVQVVVVDDVSTDASREIIRSYGERVVPVLKTVNGGHGAALNAGFAASDGAIVMFLDADDYLYPDAAEAVVGAMRADVAQVQYRLDLVDAGGARLDLHPIREVAFDDGDVRPLLMSAGRYATTVTSGLAFARAALDRILPMPPEEFRQGGDGYLVTVAPLYGRVVSIERPLGAYCKHGANHSQFLSRIAARARWRLQHDAARFHALGRHAAAQGQTLAGQIGLNDPGHLEERMTSLILDPRLHPYAGDRRLALGIAGFRSAIAQQMDAKRRLARGAIFLAMGIAPRPIAARLVSWRMEAASRPRIVDRIAKLAGRR